VGGVAARGRARGRTGPRIGIGTHDDGVRVRLEDGTHIDARLVLAADGADSAVRALAGIEVERRDYEQKGVVAYITSEQPHEDTAWQRFLSTGPLALLPLRRSAPGFDRVDLPNEEADRVLALPEDAFGDELTRAFDRRLVR
jgi:2-octaprenyl-3-methyl-6-methoxy-1,4-benzoquinol hydroxylase